LSGGTCGTLAKAPPTQILHFAQTRFEFTVGNLSRTLIHFIALSMFNAVSNPTLERYDPLLPECDSQHVTTSQHSNPSRPKASLLGSKHMVLRLIAALRTRLWRWRRIFGTGCPKDPPGGYCGRSHHAFDVNHRYRGR
jgi:hypothetical protein